MIRNVIVGISGGVDSAVSAFLLKERGYGVLGMFMKNWDDFDEFGRCSGEQDLKDAEYACKKINIELKQINYVKDYWNLVFSQFLEDYQNGLTPNPDILCNKHIKFDLFYKNAINFLKYDAIATGHYAKTSYGSFLENYRENGDVRLLLPKDTFKDQTFFLSGVKRTALQRTMFPLGDLLKSEVKSIASKIGLDRLAKKRESTGICFVGRRDFKDFIKEYIQSNPGYFIDIDTGAIVGQHNGIHQWTVGQRCRLASFSKPYFVVRKEISSSIIYVGAGHDHPALYNDCMHVGHINWLCSQPLKNSERKLHCRFRFQHTKPFADCHIEVTKVDKVDGGRYIVKLEQPLRAITPGQYAVFYSHDACLGSARILNSITKQML